LIAVSARHAPELGEREVHVWVVPLDDPDKRRRRELAHLAEGRLLASYLGVTPAMLEFERAAGGKPRLRGEPLQFNLSHSERIALVAVARERPVGVDVQVAHPNASKPWFARRVCTQREYERFAADPRPEELLRLWARKEAVIKARGEGSYVAAGELDVLDDQVQGGWLCRDVDLWQARRSLPDAARELPGTGRADGAGRGYSAAVAVRHDAADPEIAVSVRGFAWS
jgi:phosphopantetheinyl transferase